MYRGISKRGDDAASADEARHHERLRVIEMSARLTLDIDGENRNDADVKMLSRYYNVHYVYGIFPAVDLTRHGYHERAFVDDDQADMLEMRRVFGDDPKRILHSEQANRRCDNVLWSWKQGFQNQKDVKVI